MDPAELERLLDRELKALPGPRAPESLLPRVMAAVARPAESTAAPSGWFTWPLSWRLASAAAVIAFAAGVARLVLSPPARVSQGAQAAGETIAIVRVLWDLVVQPAAGYVFVLGIALALACAAAWAALEVALGGASQS